MSKHHNGAGVPPVVVLDLIRERKAELNQKTNQKRLHDLERIEKLNKTDNIGRDPNEILPDEMWEEIFDKLSPEDRTSMRQVHPVFRRAMESTHVSRNLLPQIFKFEVDKFWDSKTFVHAKNEGKVPLALYLQLRQLSRVHRDRVDHCLEEALLNLLRHGKRISKMPGLTTSFLLDSLDPNLTKLDEVLTFYRENPNSRFVSRSLEISLILWPRTTNSYLDLFEQFKKKMMSLLELIGGQILHFNFFVLNDSQEEGSSGAVKVRIPFVEWMRLMSNLQWLQIHVFWSRQLENCVDLDYLRSQPLPTLAKLKRTDFTIVPYFGPQNYTDVQLIPRSILAANPHIKTLHMIGRGHFVISTVELPFLEFFNSDLHILKHVKMVLNTKWPLKRVTLVLYLERNDTLDSVFKLLNHFSGLEHLDMKVKNVKIGGSIDFLILPQLKEFDLEVVSPIISFEERDPFHFFFSLQFLLYCKNLAKLKWTIESRDVKELRGILQNANLPPHFINFRGGWADLSKSNIWQLFPLLEFVRATDKDSNEPMAVIKRVLEYRRK